jgi:hypothetical protein
MVKSGGKKTLLAKIIERTVPKNSFLKKIKKIIYFA